MEPAFLYWGSTAIKKPPLLSGGASFTIKPISQLPPNYTTIGVRPPSSSGPQPFRRVGFGRLLLPFYRFFNRFFGLCPPLLYPLLYLRSSPLHLLFHLLLYLLFHPCTRGQAEHRDENGHEENAKSSSSHPSPSLMVKRIDE